jgi:hypothetical protein
MDRSIKKGKKLKQKGGRDISDFGSIILHQTDDPAPRHSLVAPLGLECVVTRGMLSGEGGRRS